MAFDIEAAKAAGYTDEEIKAYLQGKPELKETRPVAPGQEVDVTEPPPPTTVVTPAGEGNYASPAATAGLIAAGAAPALALGYGVGKYGGRAVDAVRGLVGGSPTTYPVGSPVTGPVNPTAPAVASNAPATRIPVNAPAANPMTNAGRAFSPQAQQFLAQQAEQQAMANPTAGNFIQRMSALARQYSPVARSVGAPAAVVSGGAALSNMAANQVRAMTPQQRQQLYSSPMMGAMSGDAGLAAAIMNAGQQ